MKKQFARTPRDCVRGGSGVQTRSRGKGLLNEASSSLVHCVSKTDSDGLAGAVPVCGGPTSSEDNVTR